MKSIGLILGYMSESGTINIKVKVFGDRNLHEVNVSPSMTVFAFKELLVERGLSDTAGVRLLHAGRLLQDDTTLASHNIADQATLHVVRRPPESTPTVQPAQGTTPSPNQQQPSQPQSQQQPPLQQPLGVPFASLFQGTGMAINDQFSGILQALSSPNGSYSQSSVVETDAAPPPPRWRPENLQSYLANIWEPEVEYSGIVHRLPYSFSAMTSMGNFHQFSGENATTAQNDGNSVAAGSGAAANQSNPVNEVSNRIAPDGFASEEEAAAYARMQLDQSPSRPLSNDVSQYAYPLHTLVQLLQEVTPRLQSLSERILVEDRIQTVEEIQRLRYDTRRIGGALRRLGTASIDLGSALNHIDWGEGIEYGTLSPNPEPSESTPQLFEAGVDRRLMRRRNPSVLRGPQVLHQTSAIQVAATPAFMTLPPTRPRRRRRNQARRDQPADEVTTPIASTPGEDAPQTPSDPVSVSASPLTQPAVSPEELEQMPVRISVQSPPAIPAETQYTLPADYMSSLGHIPVGVPLPNYQSADDMFISPSTSTSTPPAVAVGDHEDGVPSDVDMADTVDQTSSPAAQASSPSQQQPRVEGLHDGLTAEEQQHQEQGDIAVAMVSFSFDDNGNLVPVSQSGAAIGNQTGHVDPATDINSIIGGLISTLQPIQSDPAPVQQAAQASDNQPGDQNSSANNDSNTTNDNDGGVNMRDDEAPQQARHRSTRRRARQTPAANPLAGLMSAVGPLVSSLTRGGGSGVHGHAQHGAHANNNFNLSGISDMINTIVSGISATPVPRGPQARRSQDEFPRITRECDLPVLRRLMWEAVRPNIFLSRTIRDMFHNSVNDTASTVGVANAGTTIEAYLEYFRSPMVDAMREQLIPRLLDAVKQIRQYYTENEPHQYNGEISIYTGRPVENLLGTTQVMDASEHPVHEAITSVLPVFENDAYGAELTLFVNMSVQDFLTLVVTAEKIQRLKAISPAECLHLAPSAYELVHQNRLARNNGVDTVGDHQNDVVIDDILIETIQDELRGPLTEILCYIVAAIRYGPYNRQSPPVRMLFTPEEQRLHEDRIAAGSNGDYEYLSLLITQGRTFNPNSTNFSSVLLAAISQLVGGLNHILQLIFTGMTCPVDHPRLPPMRENYRQINYIGELLLGDMLRPDDDQARLTEIAFALSGIESTYPHAYYHLLYLGDYQSRLFEPIWRNITTSRMGADPQSASLEQSTFGLVVQQLSQTDPFFQPNTVPAPAQSSRSDHDDHSNVDPTHDAQLSRPTRPTPPQRSTVRIQDPHNILSPEETDALQASFAQDRETITNRGHASLEYLENSQTPPVSDAYSRLFHGESREQKRPANDDNPTTTTTTTTGELSNLD